MRKLNLVKLSFRNRLSVDLRDFDPNLKEEREERNMPILSEYSILSWQNLAQKGAPLFFRYSSLYKAYCEEHGLKSETLSQLEVLTAWIILHTFVVLHVEGKSFEGWDRIGSIGSSRAHESTTGGVTARLYFLDTPCIDPFVSPGGYYRPGRLYKDADYFTHQLYVDGNISSDL